MSTSRGFGEFSRRMTVLAGGTGKAIEQLVRKTALVADQVVVLGTPVDTGRARANWISSVNAAEERNDLPPDKTGQAALDQARLTVGRYRLGQSIFLTNNVEYISFLENGSSKQAPNGMVAAAIQAAVRVVKGSKVVNAAVRGS